MLAPFLIHMAGMKKVGMVHVFHTGWSWSKETLEAPTEDTLMKWLGGPITIIEGLKIFNRISQLIILSNSNTNPEHNFANVFASEVLGQPINGKCAVLQGLKV